MDPKIFEENQRRLPKSIRRSIVITPGTAGGPGGRDRMLVVKSRKTLEFFFFLVKK